MKPGGDGADQITARLQTRIVGFALIAVLITGIAVGFATAIPSYRSAKAEQERSAEFQVRLQALALNQYMTRLGDMAMQVTSRTIIRDKLEAYHHGKLPLSEVQAFTADKLADAMRLHSQSVGIKRLGAKGETVASIGISFSVSTPAVPEKLFYHMQRFGDQAYIVVGAPILNVRGERLGTDLVFFRSDELARILRGFKELRGATRAYLSHAERDELWSVGEAGLTATPLSAEPLLEPAIRRAFEGSHGVLRTEREHIIVSAPVMSHCAIAVDLDAPALYAPALRSLSIPVATMLSMLVLAALGTSRLLRPLAKESVRLAGRLSTTADEQRALLEYARGFLYRMDGQGRVAFISPSVREVLGSEPGELADGLVSQLASEGRLAAGASGDATGARLLRVHDGAGSVVVLEIHARADYTGENGGLLGVARDVTQRVRAEEALRAGEERLRTLINAGPDFICFKDGQGRWLEANRASLALFHVDEEGYRGRSDDELAALAEPRRGEMLRRMAEADARAWESGAPMRTEESVSDGRSEQTFDLIRVPLFDAKGERSGMVVLGRDVTERRRAEQALEQATAEWTYAMDFLDDAICLIDPDDRVVRANRAFFELTKLSNEEVIGRDVNTIFHPRGETEPCRICQARIEGRDSFITLEADHPYNPTGRPVELMVKIISGARGVPRALMGIHDLTRTRRTEQELRLAATVFEGTHEGIVIADPERKVMRVNEAFTRITGYATEESTGRTMEDVLRATVSETGSDQIWDTVARNGVWQGETWYRRKDGNLFPAWHRISALRNSQGEVLHYINLLTDITEQKLSEERIHHLAHYDGLTELPNRLLFNDRFAHSMERAKRNDVRVALLFLDLDRFKNVNDTLGHQIGDTLLQIIAERLRQSMRVQDTLARLGGDEFTVVIEDLRRLEDAATVARKMLNAIAQPVAIGSHELFVGASIGISIFPDDGRDVQTLLRNADAAMYRAKEQGRNTYRFYTPDLTHASLERLDLESSLRRALEREELSLVYQPQIEIASGRVIGAEALLRWNHPLKGMVPPDVFIPVAEESGHISAIGAWVLETACAQLQAWRRKGLTLARVAVNLSGQQIVRGNLVQTVSEILGRTGAEPRDLELEITEGFVMSHLDEGLRVLNELKALGVTLAIDDFGTGYSSLAYLKRLPIDRLKIDRSFVRDIPGDQDDMAIAATIIAMGHNLDLQVIAEGVEQLPQLEFLRRQQCDEVQGFLFGKPLSADEFYARARSEKIS